MAYNEMGRPMSNGLLGFVDEALTAIERISSVAESTVRRAIPPATTPRRPSRRSPRVAQMRRSEFEVVDSIDATTGAAEFIVRNQRGDQAVCSSLAFAERVRDRLG